ncbi:hypothetical protein D9619_012553 [Psilocybe cf. subviscida]|uniref:Uncharacterized protein n=1 Tax=Psilocybe cf. subviscida TaxID=2480587 RepID=A0A8H5EZ47_9AGAR|nr:hypothetical protein D9619_012553 [Psilocybe cf. subviscida]
MEELQHMLMRWKKAETITSHPNRPHRRRVRKLKPCQSNMPSCSILAPGGRWLIVCTHDAAAYYYDLDAADPTQTSVLFPAQMSIPESQMANHEWHQVIGSETELIPGAETLSFRFAMSFLEYPDNYASTVQVWEVTLFFDPEYHSQCRLSAHRTASISFDTALGYADVRCLSGEHLVVQIRVLCTNPGRNALVIFNWKEVQQRPSTFERRVILMDNVGFSLMYFDNVELSIEQTLLQYLGWCALMEYNLFVSMVNLEVYDYRHFEVTTSWSPENYNDNVRAIASVPGQHIDFSQPVNIQAATGTTKVVLARSWDMHRDKVIMVPLDNEYRFTPNFYPKVIGSFPLGPDFVSSFSSKRRLGYRHGIAIDNRTLQIIEYKQASASRSEASDAGIVNWDIGIDPEASFIANYDESIGRLILGDDTATLSIVDLAL